MAADLTEAFEILQRHHPNFSRHNKAADLRALFEELRDALPDTLSREQAYLSVATLVGAVCDEHTQVIKRRSDHTIMPSGWPWFELQLMVRDGQLFVEDSKKKSKAQVVSINGVSGSILAEKVVASLPNDGCYDEGVLLVNGFLKVSGHVVMAVLGSDGPYELVTRRDDISAIMTQSVPFSSSLQSKRAHRAFRRAQHWDLVTELQAKKFELQELGEALDRADLSYFFSESRDLAYLKVDSFQPPENAFDGIEQAMRDVIKRNPGALVLDFTDNPGGFTESAQLLMAFLLPRAHRLHSRAYRINIAEDLPESFTFRDKAAKDARNKDIRYFQKIKPRNGIRSTRMGRRSFGKPDYKGKIYILLSPESHSNAINVAANLKRLRHALIVGNVTAANTFSVCAAAQGSFHLKYTKFILAVPELCYSSPENKFAERGVLRPDVEVDIFNWPMVNMNTMIMRAALDHWDGHN